MERRHTGHEYSDYRNTGRGTINMKNYDYKFCGVHNKINLYPKFSDIDIIFVNKGVESVSEFYDLFQVMDYRLINSDKTNFRFMKDEKFNYQQSLSIGQMLAIEILYLKVRKISVPILHTYFNKLYQIYDGPVIDTDFKVKVFGSSIKLSSFQCVILSYVNTTNYLKYNEIRKDLSSSITLKDNDILTVQLPMPQCQYLHGQYCIIKVSLIFYAIH